MSKGDLQYTGNEFKKWVDGTLSESETVVGIRNHKMNKNYDEATGRNKGNFRNNFGKNSSSQGSGNTNNNRFGNKNFKYKK
jgi:hypothetical protein